MKEILVYLLALEVRRWDVDSRKINFTAFTVADDKEFRLLFTVSITNPADMVEELLGKVKKINKEKLHKYYDSSSFTFDYSNEHFLRQKLYNYFKRIMFELTNPKKKKSQRGIYTVRFDIYNEGQDISFLPKDIQFYVYVNWTRKYYEREQYNKVLEPLRKALEIRPDFANGYKWMGKALMRLRKSVEAQKYFEKFAEIDKSYDAYLELAHCYRKTFNYDGAEKLYKEILKKDPENFDARIGLAQIYYALRKPYKKILDKLYKENPDHVKQWLKTEWDFRFNSSKKTKLTPLLTAKFLGFENVFDLSTRAFKNEIPAHFNAAKARLIFYKEELENWIKLLGQYECLPKDIKVNPDALKGVKLEKVEVSVDANGNHIPKNELVVKGEEKLEEIEEQSPGPVANVEEIIARFNREAIIKRENENELFAQIKNGNPSQVTKKSKSGKNKVNENKDESNKSNRKKKTSSSKKTSKKNK